MFGTAEKTTNICHQIIQREANTDINSRIFAANLFRERFRVAKNLYKTDLIGHFGCVNAIEFSHGGQFLASGGDDKRVLVWEIEKSLSAVSTPPRALATEQTSNIFCLGFDSKNRKLISGGNDTLAISHDFETGKLSNIFKHGGPVYGLSIDPQNDNIFATASENGEILLYDHRSALPTVIASVPSSFQAVEFHPIMGNLLVTANSKRGATLYDIRKPKQPVILYGNLGNPRSCMSVRFNRTGKLILGLRRRLPPILYDVNSPDPICTFYHSNYYNSCTMKSCTFAGEDEEMVISGSDDFNLYVWRLSDIDLEGTEQWVESTQMVLYGHRSIVNQVRYNRQKCLLASSGVEKIIKIWSPFSQSNWTGSLTKEASRSDNPRELYSPYNLFTMELPENLHHLSYDYSSDNTDEDPRMMAFFDSLIQQDIEEWETNSSTDVSQEEDRSISSFFSCGSTSSSSSSSSTSSSSSSSSNSSSSPGSDSDNENNATMSKSRRRSKRQVVIRRKTQRQQHSKKSKLSKVKLNPLQKPTNRIEYLIAKKRNTLRRLAIKGASLNKRRSSKLVVAVNERKRTKKSNQHQSRINNSQNNERPTTSAAAAAVLMEPKRSQHKSQKKKPKIKTGSNGSSEEDSGNFALCSSSHSSAANSSSSSNDNNNNNNDNNNNNSNNMNVPSTSTGITSNFRDAFLRLSRQIFMSDSEDDDDRGNTSNKQSDVNSRNGVQHDKKLNGVNKTTNSSINSTATIESRTNSSRTLRLNQRPRNSAALNVISTNETILPQRNHPTNNEINLNNNHNDKDDSNETDNDNDDVVFGHSNRRNRVNGRDRISSSLDSAAIVGNSNCGKSPKKRRCTDFDVVEDSIAISSRISNNGYQNDSFEETTTSTSTSSSSHRDVSPKSSKDSKLQSPLKKRKLSMKNFIKANSDYSNGSIEEQPEQEENYDNDETNNNDLFSIEGNIINNNGQLTPHRSNRNDAENNNFGNNEYTISIASQHNNNSYMFTPDSGVGLNNTTTPSTIDHNDIPATASTTTARIGTYLSPCYEHTDCDVKNIKENDDDDEGVVVLNNHKTNLNQFKQKVARVRRNYRKQFFDDTESD